MEDVDISQRIGLLQRMGLVNQQYLTGRATKTQRITLVLEQDSDLMKHIYDYLLTRATISINKPNFTQELLLNVLHNLPLPDLCRMRCLSKSFNQLLASEPFWKLLPDNTYAKKSRFWILTVSHVQWLRCMAKIADFYMCIPALSGGTETKLSVQKRITGNYNNTVKVRSRFVCMDSFLLSQIMVESHLVASSGGLVCFMLRSPQDNRQQQTHQAYNANFLVVNPLTGARRKLPPVAPPVDSNNFYWMAYAEKLRMETDETTSPPSYFVIFTSRDNVLIYSSRSGQWNSKLSLLKFGTSSLKVIQNAKCFYYVYDGLSPSPQLKLYGYESKSRTLWQMDVNYHLSRDEYVFRYKRRILDACLLNSETEPEGRDSCLYKGFVVRELQQSEDNGPFRWVEVTRTPPQYWSLKHSCLTYRFLVSQGYVCAVPCLYNREVLELSQPILELMEELNLPRGPLVYDIDRDFWYILEDYRAGRFGICGVEPSLTAEV